MLLAWQKVILELPEHEIKTNTYQVEASPRYTVDRLSALRGQYVGVLSSRDRTQRQARVRFRRFVCCSVGLVYGFGVFRRRRTKTKVAAATYN